MMSFDADDEVYPTSRSCASEVKHWMNLRKRCSFSPAAQRLHTVRPVSRRVLMASKAIDARLASIPADTATTGSGSFVQLEMSRQPCAQLSLASLSCDLVESFANDPLARNHRRIVELLCLHRTNSPSPLTRSHCPTDQMADSIRLNCVWSVRLPPSSWDGLSFRNFPKPGGPENAPKSSLGLQSYLALRLFVSSSSVLIARLRECNRSFRALGIFLAFLARVRHHGRW